MITVHTPDEKIATTEAFQRSIFLAGPTPRSEKVKSWRPEALSILKELGFNGNVFVPERKDWKAKFGYEDQIAWELLGIENVTVVAFWVPRELKTMPAFTTNVEFGYCIRHQLDAPKFPYVMYGRPAGAPHTAYLDYLYKRTLCWPAENLRETLEKSVNRVNIYQPLKDF